MTFAAHLEANKEQYSVEKSVLKDMKAFTMGTHTIDLPSSHHVTMQGERSIKNISEFIVCTQKGLIILASVH